jgi:hypothetical protein
MVYCRKEALSGSFNYENERNMNMNVLVINCGSSSLKYQLINSDTETVLAKGLCERIGIEGSAIAHQKAGEDKVKTEVPMANHTDAVKLVIEKPATYGSSIYTAIEVVEGMTMAELEIWYMLDSLYGG